MFTVVIGKYPGTIRDGRGDTTWDALLFRGIFFFRLSTRVEKGNFNLLCFREGFFFLSLSNLQSRFEEVSVSWGILKQIILKPKMDKLFSPIGTFSFMSLVE